MIPSASSYLAIDDRLTVVEAAFVDRAWAERVLADRPETHLHQLPHAGAAAIGLDYLEGRPLDRAVAELGVRHVNYLRIANPAAAVPVLLGARRLLSHARIDIIEIAEADATAPVAAAVVALLEPFEFLQLPASEKLNDLLLTPFGFNGVGVAFFGIHRRFVGAIIGGNREPDLGALMTNHRLSPRGIVQVGAHAGEEVASYLALGFERILLVEAHPTLAADLAKRYAGEPRVAVAARAISDADGMVDLHLASSTVSSSILSIKRHAEVFPDISETAQIRVPAQTLDGLLADRRYAANAFNIAVIDIQGAELLALRGATSLLQQLEGLLVEINFAELYENCAQIEDIDDFLVARGFVRVMTMSPYQSSYGDAFYLRTAV